MSAPQTGQRPRETEAHLDSEQRATEVVSALTAAESDHDRALAAGAESYPPGQRGDTGR